MHAVHLPVSVDGTGGLHCGGLEVPAGSSRVGVIGGGCGLIMRGSPTTLEAYALLGRTGPAPDEGNKLLTLCSPNGTLGL